MKREAFGHAKFRLIARDLKIPIFAAYGLAASIWNTTGVRFPRGDIGRLTNEEIAAEIDGYEGDGERLVEVLIARRLLDRHDEHRLVVHDWPEHADGHVHAYLAKRGLFFANGEEPRLPHERFDGPTRARIRAEYRAKSAEPHGRAAESSGSNPRVAPEATGDLPSMPVPVPVPLRSDQETTEFQDSTVAASSRGDDPPKASTGSARATAARRGKLSHFVPDDFVLTQAQIEYATKQGLSPAEVPLELEKMRDHEFRDPHSDWDRTWKRWVRTAVARQVGPGGGRARGAPPPGRFLTAAEQSEASFDAAMEVRRGN